MAATSPVLIRSSPSGAPDRGLSITPPSAQYRDAAPDEPSSSPRLLSPSAFVKSRPAAALKSGSRALRVPDGARTGFASARVLWKSSHFGDDGAAGAAEQVDVRASRAPLEEITDGKRTRPAAVACAGKLVRPRKALKRKESAADMLGATDEAHGAVSAKARSPRRRRCEVVLHTAQPAEADEAPTPARMVAGNVTEQAASNTDVNQDGVSVGQRPPSDRMLAAEGNTTDTTIRSINPTADISSAAPIANDKQAAAPTPKVRRARKRKSESIIINSDSPERASDSQAILHTEPCAETLAAAGPADKPRPKRRKADSKSVPPAETGAVAVRIQSDLAPLTADSYTSNLHGDTVIGNSASLGGSALVGLAVDAAEPRLQPTNDNGFASEIASRRRQSWTPVKDTAANASTCDSPESNVPQMKAILDRFHHIPETTESPTKAKASARPSTTKPRSKPSKGPKKPQTITALATAAYRRPENLGDAVASADILSYMPIDKDTPATCEHDTVRTAPGAVKLRAPRKRQTKATGTDETSKKTASSSRKGKAAAQRQNDDVLELFSPTQASAQMKRQDFLFGTSSQLALPESPKFIRDLQSAIYESEMTESHQTLVSSQVRPSQISPGPRRGKSCVRVPTAPHGTLLSVDQADRELWCVAARQRDGGLFRHRAARSLVDETQTSTRRVPDMQQIVGVPCVRPGASRTNAVGFDQAATTARVSVQAARELDGSHLGLPGVVAEANEPIDFALPLPASPHIADETQLTAYQSAQVAKEDSVWSVLNSDSSDLPSPETRQGVDSKPTPLPSARSLLVPTIQQPQTASRSPLQKLNANRSLLTHAHAAQTYTSQPCRTMSTKPTVDAKLATPVKRPRGRPRKDAASLTAKRKSKTKDAAPRSPPQHSGWTNIDEISDSDSPTTPSPPRRRSGSPKPAMPTLDLLTADSSEQAIANAQPNMPAGATIKPGEPCWANISAELFPRITSLVRAESATRGSRAGAEMCWWDRILMYDPIVLEDLTAWLSAQGLRIEVRRLKPKAKKKKGRPKKVQDETNVREDAAESEVWEMHEDEVKPWMVQKWCEENGICCLWKESARHGVRKGLY